MFSPRSPRPALCWYTQRSAHACATAAASEDQVSGESGGLGAGRAVLRTALCASSHPCASAVGGASGLALAPASGSPARPSPHAQARRGTAIHRPRRIAEKLAIAARGIDLLPGRRPSGPSGGLRVRPGTVLGFAPEVADGGAAAGGVEAQARLPRAARLR